MKFTPNDIAKTALRKAGKYSDVAYVQIIEEMINNLLAEEKASFISLTGNLHKPLVSGWVATTDKLPKSLQTVWVCNGKGWIALGCLVETNEGWHWAESNGVIYIENGEIVAECESDDLDVVYWHELPKPPCH